MVSLVGRTVHEYHLVRRLRCGGMGEVYLAEEAGRTQTMALKILSPPTLASASTRRQVRRFREEIDIVAALDHPGILPLVANGYARVEGRWLWYLVMPYCAGGSLADWVAHPYQGQALPSELVVPLMMQVTDALAYAHAQGVCHLDVKAANLLLSQPAAAVETPRLLLADFGVARCWEQPVSSREAGTIWGTPGVMAPEQWHGMPEPASDQYALAVLTYTLLTGHAPFVGSPAQLRQQHLSTPPVAPSLLLPTLSPWVDAILLQALAKDPTRRFSSVRHFAQALTHALQPDEQADISSMPVRYEKQTPGNVQQGTCIDPALHTATTVACSSPVQVQGMEGTCETWGSKIAQMTATQPVGRRSPGEQRSTSPPSPQSPSMAISWWVGVGGLLFWIGSYWIAFDLPEQCWLLVPLCVVSLGGGFWLDGRRERKRQRRFGV